MVDVNVFGTQIISISPKIVKFVYINSSQSIADDLEFPWSNTQLILEIFIKST